MCENFLNTTIKLEHEKITMHQKQLVWNTEQQKHHAPKANIFKIQTCKHRKHNINMKYCTKTQKAQNKKED